MNKKYSNLHINNNNKKVEKNAYRKRMQMYNIIHNIHLTRLYSIRLA